MMDDPETERSLSVALDPAGTRLSRAEFQGLGDMNQHPIGRWHSPHLFLGSQNRFAMKRPARARANLKG